MSNEQTVVAADYITLRVRDELEKALTPIREQLDAIAMALPMVRMTADEMEAHLGRDNIGKAIKNYAANPRFKVGDVVHRVVDDEEVEYLRGVDFVVQSIDKAGTLWLAARHSLQGSNGLQFNNQRVPVELQDKYLVVGHEDACEPVSACATHGRCWTHSRWSNMDEVEPLDYTTLDPGIRTVVHLLRWNGFDTTDSGDGVTKGEDGAPFPHVFAVVPKHQLIQEADRLHALCVEEGIPLGPNEHESEDCNDHPYIHVSYDPAPAASEVRSAIVGLIGVNDAMLDECRNKPSKMTLTKVAADGTVVSHKEVEVPAFWKDIPKAE